MGWVVFDNLGVARQQVGGMSKPTAREARRLLETSRRLEDAPFVCPSVFDPAQTMSAHAHFGDGAAILQRAGYCMWHTWDQIPLGHREFWHAAKVGCALSIQKGPLVKTRT